MIDLVKFLRPAHKAMIRPLSLPTKPLVCNKDLETYNSKQGDSHIESVEQLRTTPRQSSNTKWTKVKYDIKLSGQTHSVPTKTVTHRN